MDASGYKLIKFVLNFGTCFLGRNPGANNSSAV